MIKYDEQLEENPMGKRTVKMTKLSEKEIEILQTLANERAEIQRQSAEAMRHVTQRINTVYALIDDRYSTGLATGTHVLTNEGTIELAPADETAE